MSELNLLVELTQGVPKGLQSHEPDASWFAKIDSNTVWISNIGKYYATTEWIRNKLLNYRGARHSIGTRILALTVFRNSNDRTARGDKPDQQADDFAARKWEEEDPEKCCALVTFALGATAEAAVERFNDQHREKDEYDTEGTPWRVAIWVDHKKFFADRFGLPSVVDGSKHDNAEGKDKKVLQLDAVQEESELTLRVGQWMPATTTIATSTAATSAAPGPAAAKAEDEDESVRLKEQLAAVKTLQDEVGTKAYALRQLKKHNRAIQATLMDLILGVGGGQLQDAHDSASDGALKHVKPWLKHTNDSALEHHILAAGHAAGKLHLSAQLKSAVHKAEQSAVEVEHAVAKRASLHSRKQKQRAGAAAGPSAQSGGYDDGNGSESSSSDSDEDGIATLGNTSMQYGASDDDDSEAEEDDLP
jgi:hypothetical protein